MNEKFYLEADITIQEETELLKEQASKVITLPSTEAKQPDLMYFSAIFVSSGQNLNNAHFMSSELVAAENTIVNKALDIEHEEQEIIGHIYERAYMDKDGNKLELTELSSKESASLDSTDMHIAIAGIIYKTRFPTIAKEVADNKWKVSMECFFKDYDVKIGDVVMTRNEAEALGLATQQEGVFGKMAKIIKGGKELATGKIARVLRGICFSGCGIVKNPANPPSVILEVAKENTENKEVSDDIIILDYDSINKEEATNSDELDNNNVTLENIEDTNTEVAVGMDDTENICSYYKHKVFDKNNELIKEHWCAAYEQGCTSFSRGLQDPDCLRNKNIQNVVVARYNELYEKSAKKDKRERLLKDLKAALREAVKTRSR